MQAIKFGTDGWRAVIGEDFTFANVSVVAQAIGDYLKEKRGRSALRVAIGYDTRFLSDRFAGAMGEVLCGNGIRVRLSREVCSTPALSLAVQKEKFSAGVMITASHNPARFSGIKFKESFGGPADPAVTARIESWLGRRRVKRMPMAEARRRRRLETADFKSGYFRRIRSYLDWKMIRKARFRILADSMFGAGDEFLAELFRDTGCRVTTIHAGFNPAFGGVNPEPIERNLKEAARTIRAGDFDIGIATDGDADRIGALAPDGTFIDAQKIFALMLLHLLEDRGGRGDVGKTISTTALIDRIAAKHHLRVHETPVGFKYITQLLLSGKLLIGGEESGGFGFRDYLRERDGIMSGLLLVEMMAFRKRGITRLIADMEKEFGKLFFRREDLEYPERLKKILVDRLLKKPLTRLAGVMIKRIRTDDGIKFVADDDSWLLMRLSGTEPILRIYAEAPEKKRVEAIMKAGKATAFGIERR